MEEYVTKEKVLAQLERCARDPYHETHYLRDAVINTIRRMEAADVVAVVRCKDCFLFDECKAAEWYGENGNGYCSVGDRRKEMRLIDADALASALNNGRLEEQTGRAVPFNAGVAFALTMVEYAPTIDAVPVVRCKDCKCWTECSSGTGSCSRFALDWIGTDADDFCSMGERKDDE